MLTLDMLTLAMMGFTFVVVLVVGGLLYRLGPPRSLGGLLWTIAILALCAALSFALPGRSIATDSWVLYLAVVTGATLAACLLTYVAHRMHQQQDHKPADKEVPCPHA